METNIEYGMRTSQELSEKLSSFDKIDVSIMTAYHRFGDGNSMYVVSILGMRDENGYSLINEAGYFHSFYEESELQREREKCFDAFNRAVEMQNKNL